MPAFLVSCILQARRSMMYRRRIVAPGPADTIFRTPRRRSTRLPPHAMADLRMAERSRRPVGGELPRPIDPPAGGRFHPPRPPANARCRTPPPPPRRQADTPGARHAVAEAREAA